MAEKQKHHMLSVNISNARMPVYQRLRTLAEKLNCRFTDLVWYGLENLVNSPPTVAPAGAAPLTGSAAGFWVVHDLDGAGQVDAIRVVECIRSMIKGRVFFRYAREDEKSRGRAERQAVKAAAYDAQITGIVFPETGVPIERMEMPPVPEAGPAATEAEVVDLDDDEDVEE